MSSYLESARDTLRRIPEMVAWVQALDVEHLKLSDADREKLAKLINWISVRDSELRFILVDDPANTDIRDGKLRLASLRKCILAELKKDEDLKAKGQ